MLQDFILSEYKPLPFEINTRKLVPLILDTIEKLPNELKTSGYYARLIGNIKSIPSFKYYEVEKVEKILKEFKEKYDNPPKDIKLWGSLCGYGDNGGILNDKTRTGKFH